MLALDDRTVATLDEAPAERGGTSVAGQPEPFQLADGVGGYRRSSGSVCRKHHQRRYEWSRQVERVGHAETVLL